MGRQTKANRPYPRCPKCGASGRRLQRVATKHTTMCGSCAVSHRDAATARALSAEEDSGLNEFLASIPVHRAGAVRRLLIGLAL